MADTYLTPEVMHLAEKIRRDREQKQRQATVDELVALTPVGIRDSSISADEVASLASAITGRTITRDYVKHLRLAERIPSRRVGARAFVFKLRDALFLDYRQVGRPRKVKI
ncbi:MAG: hypothetical protein ACR2H5_14370 [Ktedonobacteraceae bacterium]